MASLKLWAVLWPEASCSLDRTAIEAWTQLPKHIPLLRDLLLFNMDGSMPVHPHWGLRMPVGRPQSGPALSSCHLSLCLK